MSIADFHLPPRLRATAAQFARVVCPPELEELGLTDTVVDHFERSMRSIPTFLRHGMVAGLLALELGAVARFGKTFSRLDKTRARLWHRSWSHSPLLPFRKLVAAMKSLTFLAYFEQTAVKERMRYHPERWIAAVARRRLDTYGAEIRAKEEELLAPNPLIKPARLLRRLRHA